MSILSRKSTPARKLPIPKLDPATVQPLSKLTASEKNFLEPSAVSLPRGTEAEQYATSVPATVQPLPKLTASEKNFLEPSAVSLPRGTEAGQYATSVPSAVGPNGPEYERLKQMERGGLAPLSHHLSVAEKATLVAPGPAAVESSLPLAEAVAVHTRAVLKAKKGIARSVLTLGQHLAAVKQLYSDSPRTFTKWCRSTVTMTTRSVRNYIAVHNRFGTMETVSKFDTGALILLASPSCPPKAVADAIELSGSQRVVQKDAKRLIKQYTISTKPARSKPRTLTISTSIGTISIQSDNQDATAAEVLAALVSKLQSMRKAA